MATPSNGQVATTTPTLTTPPLRRFEAGVQFTNLGFRTCLQRTDCAQDPPKVALGPTLTINLNHLFSMDAAANIVAKADDHPTDYADGTVAGGRGLELQISPRAELRSKRYGFFVDAKVGLLSWSQIYTGLKVTQLPGGAGYLAEPAYGRGTFFEGGGGVGVDYFPNSRTTLRLEVADQVVDYRNVAGPSCTITTSSSSPLTSNCPSPAAWNSSAVLRAGISQSFGRPLEIQPTAQQSEHPHRFFDKTNLLVLSASLAAQGADAVTTQHFLKHNIPEANSLAAPFVDQGWPGQIGLGVIVNAAQISVMYGLHSMGHHRVERLLPLLTIPPSAYSAYRNTRDFY